MSIRFTVVSIQNLDRLSPVGVAYRACPAHAYVFRAFLFGRVVRTAVQIKKGAGVALRVFMNRFGLGLIVGLLLSAPLVSILYLLNATTGTPFIPFDLFDSMVRILPGGLITFGIETMVRLLMFLGVNLSNSSKVAEQIQAIAIFLSISALTAGIFFIALKTGSSRSIVPLGIVLGIVTALPMTIVAGFPVWTMVALTAWGMAVSAVHYRVGVLVPNQAPSATPELAAHPSSLEPVDRRRFLVNLGGATASITVVGAVVAAALRTSSEPVVHATRMQRSQIGRAMSSRLLELGPNTRQLPTITASILTSAR